MASGWDAKNWLQKLMCKYKLMLVALTKYFRTRCGVRSEFHGVL
jgi:hypothetical protein